MLFEESDWHSTWHVTTLAKVCAQCFHLSKYRCNMPRGLPDNWFDFLYRPSMWELTAPKKQRPLLARWFRRVSLLDTVEENVECSE
jgi:hypothetical protein